MKGQNLKMLLSLALLWSCAPEEGGAGAGPFEDLPRLELPAEFPARPGAPLPAAQALNDSAFIVRYIDPAYSRNEEPKHQYGKGMVVLETKHFTAIAYPLYQASGSGYFLCTYAPPGRLLDTLTLAQVDGAGHIQSAAMDAEGGIRTSRLYLDGSRHPLLFAYRITPKGNIGQEPVVRPRGAGLLKSAEEY